MDSTPNFPGNHALGGSLLAGGEKRRSAQTRRLSLWHLCHVSALLSSQRARTATSSGVPLSKAPTLEGYILAFIMSLSELWSHQS